MSETDAEFVERLAADRNGPIYEAEMSRLFALAGRGAAMQWRPIEEAPRDTRWFLAGCPTEYDVYGGSKFWAGTARFEYPTDDHPELMRANGYDAGPTHATHFMPLPPPPKGAEDE